MPIVDCMQLWWHDFIFVGSSEIIAMGGIGMYVLAYSQTEAFAYTIEPIFGYGEILVDVVTSVDKSIHE